MRHSQFKCLILYIFLSLQVFDKDHSGSLSNAELRRIVTTYGEVLNEEEADEMIKDADTDGDGFVDYTGIDYKNLS